MIRKQSETSKLVDSLLSGLEKKDYRKELANREPEMKQQKQAERDRSWAVQKGYESTEFNNPVARSGNSIRPSRCDSQSGISDIGGPTKHVGVTGKNSIFDTEVLSRMAQELSSKEKTFEEKSSTDRLKMKKQAEYKQNMSPKIGEEESVEKVASITGDSITGSSKGWVPANKFSIFDTNENFDRLTALTERVNPTVAKEKKVEKTASVSKALSSKDLTNKFVEGISNQDSNSSYKSMHKETVERLFNILKERNSKGQ